MVKQLMPRKNRGWRLLNILVVVTALATGAFSTPAWSYYLCSESIQYYYGPEAVQCDHPEAVACFTMGAGSVETCASYGYTFGLHSTGDGDSYYCLDAECNPYSIASVPEFEDYAAMLFVTLALLSGWHIRRRAMAAV